MADWFYSQGTSQRGPVPLETLIDSLRSGALSPSDLVWHDGMPQWTPAGQVPELAGAAGGAPAAVPQAAGFPSAPAAMMPNYSSPAAKSPHAGLATTSMVLGILSFFCLGILTGLAALICGIIALNGMKRTGDTRKRGFALAGVICGSIGMVLSVIGIFFLVASSHHAVPMYVPPSPPSP
jgi:hypothetical protein